MMTKNIKQYIPIFVSSTSKDMIPYRQVVLNVLNKLKLGVKGMEVFGARTDKPLKTCLDEVSKSQFFIGILGMRYGSLDKETGKSIVQLEYEKAMEKSLGILIYRMDEDKSNIHPKFVDRYEEARKLGEFKELLRKKHTFEAFQSPKDLATKMERDLLRSFFEKGLMIENGKIKTSVESKKILDLLRKFDLMPTRFSGSEVELIIKFEDSPRSVSKDLCEAINLEFGQSISRPIAVMHPQIETLDFIVRLYAEYDGCDFLYDAPMDKEFKIIARLVFGEERKDTWYQSPISPDFTPPFLIASPITYLETRRPSFEHHISYTPVKALVLVKTIDKP